MDTAIGSPESVHLAYFGLLAAATLAVPWGFCLRSVTVRGLSAPAAPRQLWPLLLTLPALLLGLGREVEFLQALSGLDAASPMLGSTERVLLAAYLAAAAALYYRHPVGRAAWAWAAVLCAVPMLLAMQAAWTGGLWADESGSAGHLLPDLLAFGLGLGAWVGLLMLQRQPEARTEQALA